MHSELHTKEYQTILRSIASLQDKCGMSCSLVLVHLYSNLEKCYNNMHIQSIVVYNKSEKAAINILGWEPKLSGGSNNQSGKTKQYLGVFSIIWGFSFSWFFNSGSFLGMLTIHWP